MQIKSDEVLDTFIMEALPITWGMVTASLPVVSSSKVDEYDHNVHEMIVESHEQAAATNEWVCTKPALYRCLDTIAEQKATIVPKGLCTSTPIYVSFYTHDTMPFSCVLDQSIKEK